MTFSVRTFSCPISHSNYWNAMESPDLKNRLTYNFDVHPTAFIGNNYKNVTVMAIMDRETANKEIDTAALHIQCFPTLPAGTPNDPDAYDYVKLKMPSGATTIIGLAWIKSETVTLVDARTITAKIGNVTATDLAKIKAALVQNGYSSIELSIS